MLKRILICVGIICTAQSLTLTTFAQEDELLPDNRAPQTRTGDLIPATGLEVEPDQPAQIAADDLVPDNAQRLEPESFKPDAIEPAVQFNGLTDNSNTQQTSPAHTLTPSTPSANVQRASDSASADGDAMDQPVTGRGIDESRAADDTAAVETAGAGGAQETVNAQTDSTETASRSATSQVADSESDNQSTLNEQVQNLKQQVLELNKDLFILEEELLFPANTQVAIFLSMNVGEFFQLDAVKLTIDEKVVTNYLYTARQVDALHRGGVQRLFLGNLKTGEHEVVAVFTGRGPRGRDFRRATTLLFDKTAQAKHIELKIVDSTPTRQPEFVVKEW